MVRTGLRMEGKATYQRPELTQKSLKREVPYLGPQLREDCNRQFSGLSIGDDKTFHRKSKKASSSLSQRYDSVVILTQELVHIFYCFSLHLHKTKQ